MILYGGGAVVGVWLASTVVGAINSVPLVGFSCDSFPSLLLCVLRVEVFKLCVCVCFMFVAPVD